MKVLARTVGVVCLMGVAFVIGRTTVSERASARSGAQIQFVQAERRWHNVEAFREIQAYLEKGCSQSAKEKVAAEVEVNLMLLAAHLQADPQGVLATMLESRAPELLEEARSHKVDWRRTFTVQECISSDPASST